MPYLQRSKRKWVTFSFASVTRCTPLSLIFQSTSNARYKVGCGLIVYGPIDFPVFWVRLGLIERELSVDSLLPGGVFLIFAPHLL